jgi:hypothetical protein
MFASVVTTILRVDSFDDLKEDLTADYRCKAAPKIV